MKLSKTKKAFGAVALGVLAISGGLVGMASAYQGDPTVQGPYYDPAIHEDLQNAIENGDYVAWMNIRTENNLPTRGRVFSVINQDNFNLFQELHEANLNGDYDRAQEIRQELGLGIGSQYRGQGKGQGMRGRGIHRA